MALCVAGNAYELFWPRFDIENARPAHVPAPWTRRFVFDDAELSAVPESAQEEEKSKARVGMVELGPESERGESLPAGMGGPTLDDEDSLTTTDVAELADLLNPDDELDEAPVAIALMPSVAEIEALLARAGADVH